MILVISIANQSDNSLLQSIALGNETAFREIFERYTPRLNAFFTKMTKDPVIAKELVQEVFFSLWQYRSGLDAVQNPSAYIYRIASNKALRYYRKEALDRKILEELATQTNDITEESSLLQVKELHQLLQEAVEKLPPQQQQVFRYSREQGLTAIQIAKKMGLTEKTVRNHLTLSLKSIQAFLQAAHSMYLPLFLLAILVLE